MQTIMADVKDTTSFPSKQNLSPTFMSPTSPPEVVSTLNVKPSQNIPLDGKTREREDLLRLNNENMDIQGGSSRTSKPANTNERSKEKEFQAQLEMSQFKLHDLAKKIDECLSAGKINYAESNLIHQSSSSISKSSLNEIIEAPLTNDTRPEPRPDSRSEKSAFSKNTTDRGYVSADPKFDSRPESRNEKSAFSKNATERSSHATEIRVESKVEPKNEKSAIEKKQLEKIQKPAPAQKSVPLKKPTEPSEPEVKSARKPTTEPKKTPEKNVVRDLKAIAKPKVNSKPLTKSPVKNNFDPKKAPASTSDFQRQFDTVSSLTVETLDDVSKHKEIYVFSPKESDDAQSFTDKVKPVSQPKQMLNQNRSPVNAETSETTLSASKFSNPVKPAIQDSRFSFSNSLEVVNNLKKQLPNESPTKSAAPAPADDQSINLKTDPEEKRRYELDDVKLSKHTIKSNYEGFEDDKEETTDLNHSVQMRKPISSKPEALKTNPPQRIGKSDAIKTKSNGISATKLKLPSEPITKKSAPDFDFNGEDKLDIASSISPVVNDRRSSRVTKDPFTPGYNFDAGNSSMNDIRNLSFDSALLGRDFSVKDQDRGRERSNVSYNDAGKNLDDSKRTINRTQALSQGRADKSYYDDDLETSFTKAYTVRKNKIINDVNKFDERMDSDIYFRRRFQDDLQKFLNEYKPKLSEEQAEKLIMRLVEDSRKREIRNHKLQLQNDKSLKTTQENLNNVSEDQLNQTFERLAADARKRMFLQEEKEKLKQIRDHEEEERAVQEQQSMIKMSKKAEENLVIKLTEDAERRRLKFEKLQRAKIEEEIRQANDLLTQGFKNKNNRAKSKVREYIESDQPKTPRTPKTPKRESKSTTRGGRADRRLMSKSFHGGEKSILTSRDLATPIAKDSPILKETKFPTPKSRYLNIASPAKRTQSKESPKNFGEKSPKPEDVSSLEYLKTLRRDINKYKSNIEEHIQTIKSIDSSSTLQGNPQSTTKSQSHIQKQSISEVGSPKNTKAIPFKVPAKYKNVQSKVALHIEGKVQESREPKSPQNVKTRDIAPTPSNRRLSKQNAIPSKTSITPQNRDSISSKLKKQESEDGERKSRVQSRFMNDKSAINFVEKLINDFKTSSK